MRKLCAALAISVTASAQSAPTSPAETLLDRATLTALDEELSGVAAKDHVSRLTQLHRVPASPGFHEAIEYVKERATVFGLSDVHVETFPGDGNTWFGTLHGNRGWRVEGGTLDEGAAAAAPYPVVRRHQARRRRQQRERRRDRGARRRRQREPIGATTMARTCAASWSSATPRRPRATGRRSKSTARQGLISYNSNQVSAWWRDDQDLIRWGHLDSRGRRNTFALMISVREARSLQQRLASGERITLHAVVKARNDDSMPYETLVATIPGTDSSSGDIVFSCHLDHEKPGANDNASGCSANLEIARALRVLIAAKRIPAPVRTIRFVWPSEMTGTIAYLSKYPAIASRIRAAVHLDMVGGDPFVTKSILHVTRSPWSIATVTDDVQETFGRYVIDGAMRAAGDGDMTRAIRSPRGSKDAFWADITPYESGSDHWIYQEGAFAFPPSTFAITPTSTFTRPATWPTTSNRPKSSGPRSSPPPAATIWRRCPTMAPRCFASPIPMRTSVWRKMDAVRRPWPRLIAGPTPRTSSRRRCCASSAACARCRGSWTSMRTSIWARRPSIGSAPVWRRPRRASWPRSRRVGRISRASVQSPRTRAFRSGTRTSKVRWLPTASG
jgi:hypothetical protein